MWDFNVFHEKICKRWLSYCFFKHPTCRFLYVLSAKTLSCKVYMWCSDLTSHQSRSAAAGSRVVFNAGVLQTGLTLLPQGLHRLVTDLLLLLQLGLHLLSRTHRLLQRDKEVRFYFGGDPENWGMVSTVYLNDQMLVINHFEIIEYTLFLFIGRFSY